MKTSTYYFSSVALTIGLGLSVSAHALTLGRLSALSFLGQPLVAEVEVPDISAEEAGSLRVLIADADAFKSAGLEYSSAVAELKITGKRRADGRAILEIRGTQPVTKPFVDLILDVAWNAGRMFRDYTVLLDTPAVPNQVSVAPVPTLPMLAANRSANLNTNSIAIANTNAVPGNVAIQEVSEPAITNFSVKTQTENSLSRIRSKSFESNISRNVKNGIRTKKGDTAAILAMTSKPEGVSLEQMLVAMLRSNPQAFVDGNVNRLKAGVVMSVPSAEEAQSIRAIDAKNSIQAQTHDFNDYRRKLATNAATHLGKESNQQVSGRVAAKVQDRQTQTASDDRLTLAKPVSPSKTAMAEDAIAQNRAAQDAAARATELNRNISELNRLTASSTNGATATPAPALSAAPVPLAITSAPVPVASSASAPPQTVLPPQPADLPLLDQVLNHPLLLPFAGLSGVALLLGALFNLRRRRSRELGASRDSSINFPPTRQPYADTVFGPMGANDVNTQEAQQTNHSVTPHTPHQSSPTGDVDPIAEADVYLAYNRDVQAEEILKEGKRNAPKRTDIQLKLLEIYAKRPDLEAFDAVAQELHLITDGVGSDWSKARILAREAGSTHLLFQVHGSAFSAYEPIATVNQSAYHNQSLSFVPTPPPPASIAPSLPPSGAGLIDFDLSSLSLDLPSHSQGAPSLENPVQEDPKLALAEEYLSIGDKSGARALIDEVILYNANSHTVALAQQMLSRIA